MSFPKLELGDLVLTRQYSGEQSVEIVQFRATTGQLLYLVYHPDIVLVSQKERFIRDCDSMPQSVSIVRKSDTENWHSVINAIAAIKQKMSE